MARREILNQGIYDMSDVRSVNARAGQHWFEPATMRFFRSRVGDTLYGQRYFVSSEQFDYNSPRLYTVRELNDDGGIDTVGEFQGYTTRAQAIGAIRRLLAERVNA
jgi:hypothetical protein